MTSSWPVLAAASDSAVPRLARGVRLRPDGPSGPALLSPERGALLSESALAVVRLVDGERDVQAIVRTLEREYSGAPELRAEVAEFLRELTQRRLVTLTPRTAGRDA